MTPITADLLHGQGFQSYYHDNNVWWEYPAEDRWAIFYDAHHRRWWTPAKDDVEGTYWLDSWEDFLAYYYKFRRQQFQPLAPVMQFFLHMEAAMYNLG